jgi:hypothetical protein
VSARKKHSKHKKIDKSTSKISKISIDREKPRDAAQLDFGDQSQLAIPTSFSRCGRINSRWILMEYVLREGFPFDRCEFDERMVEAEKHLFSLGLCDAAEEMGRVNAALFLAKLHYIQEQLGYNRYAMFIGAPDFTFQTSSYKFRDAVPEGGKVVWGDGTYDFVPTEMEPDFCGLLVGAVEDNLSLEKILDTLYGMRIRDDYYIGNVKVKLRNFRPGSHFLNLYRVEGHEVLDLPRMVAVLHTSSDEMRDLLTNFIQDRGEVMQTPFGCTSILRGDDALEYEKRCKYASKFAKEKRKLLFEEIFSRSEVLSNENHYELTDLNKAIIGCQSVHKQGDILPITLINGSSAYLVKGRMNISQKVIEELGFDSRELEGWVYEGLLNANIAPHGGGHKLINMEGVQKVILYPQAKVIIPQYKGKACIEAYADMETVFRSYRSEGVLERVQSLGLADHCATLTPIYGIKVDF